MPVVSIIIPCYNVEKYIDTCIESVFNQNLSESELEVIIVNDGSTDNSLLIIQQLVGNKCNVKILSQENKGLGGARNTGIINATGTYLLFLDADDLLLPNCLKNVLDIADLQGLDILEFSAQGVNESGSIVYHIANDSEVYSSGVEYYCKVRYMNSACNKIYKRDFLVAHHLLFLERIYIEDFEFNTRCLINAKKIKATDLLIVQFLQSTNSITRNKDLTKKQKMIDDIFKVIKITDKQYKNHSTIIQKSFYLERLNFLVASLFVQLIKNKVSYNEINALKLKLEQDNILYINHRIFEVRKNILRIILLRNLWTYKLIKLFF